jgi:hypothetical protein
MDKVLPFEYGVFYKLIEKPTEEDKNKLGNIQYTETLKPYFNNNGMYDSVQGWVENTYLANEHNFLPIGFIEQTQEVVLECIVNENERISGLMYLSGSQMRKSDLTKNTKRITRVKIDAPLFIRNFEKVI